MGTFTCQVARVSPDGTDFLVHFLSGSLICSISQSGESAGLAGERTRWEASILTLDAQLAALPGDVALASAFMSYAGPFPSEYRDELSKSTWQKTVKIETHIHCSAVAASCCTVTAS